MTNETPQVLLHKLCSKLTGLKGDALTLHYKIALATISSSVSNPAENDEFKIAERIKKKLVQRGRVEDAAVFAELHRSIQSTTMLKNRGAMIALFYSLSGDTSANTKCYQSNAFVLGVTQQMSSTPFVGSHLRPVTGDTASLRYADMASLRTGSSTGTSGISSIATSGRGDTMTSHGDTVSPPKTLALRAGLPPMSMAPQVTITEFHRTYSAKTDVSGAGLTGHRHSATVGTKSSADNTSCEIPEAMLIRDILYVCQGIEGTYIKYDAKKEGFTIDPRAGISLPVRQQLLRLAECGWLHNKVRRYADARSSERAFGLVGQSFCTALHQELTEYYRLIAVLETQLEQSDGWLTLRRLTVWTCDPRVRLRTLAALVDICHGQKGGALASAIHSYIQHGDPAIRALVQHTLTLVAQPIFSTITTWIYDGQLEDTYHEFFVASDPTVKDDRLWHDKYSLRKSMIPSFLTMPQANKVLLTGKSINFLRQVCQDRTTIRNRDRVRSSQTHQVESIFSQSRDGMFQKMIDTIYKETSEHLLQVLHTKYQFMDHLKAMRRYLLLGQGDFIRHLMDLLEEDLAKPAATLFLHRLTGILDQAIRATNAQYDDLDILKRIDVRLLEVSPGDTGWDVFSLDYHVDGPIRTVFTPECMIMYLRVFNFLWRAKRMEYTLSAIWKNQNHNTRLLRALTELRPVLHQCHVIAAEMVHFVQQVQYYINFEVLECSWHELLKKVKEAEDLDHVIAAHEVFLDTIIARSLLDNESSEILTQLRAIFDLVIQFQMIQENVYTSAEQELAARTAYDRQAAQAADKGKWGKTERSEGEERKRRRVFCDTLIPLARSQLRVLAQSYQNMTQQFLVMLTGHSDMNLRFLSFRLDFNEHYKEKEPKMRSPMSYLKSKHS